LAATVGKLIQIRNRELTQKPLNTNQADQGRQSSRKDRLAGDLRFAKNWLTKPVHTGSITPTGKAASRLMASLIPADSGLPVLELGPGTGPVTRAILETDHTPAQLTCVEFNGNFCRHLEREFPGVEIINGDAFSLDVTLGPDRKRSFSGVLSGLPLLNFPRPVRGKFISDALGFVREGGPFIQLCYGPKAPFDFVDGGITSEPTKWVLANIPPARFWIYREKSV
jgi:phosphatidylethanolamine/phosphatidyl-N-methylethanolamine N-methyltransferase